MKFFMEKLRREDRDPRTFNGDSPFLIAVRHGHLDVVNYLMNLTNIYIQAKNHNGRTALHLSVRHYDLAIKFFQADLCLFESI